MMPQNQFEGPLPILFQYGREEPPSQEIWSYITDFRKDKERKKVVDITYQVWISIYKHKEEKIITIAFAGTYERSAIEAMFNSEITKIWSIKAGKKEILKGIF